MLSLQYRSLKRAPQPKSCQIALTSRYAHFGPVASADLGQGFYLLTLATWVFCFLEELLSCQVLGILLALGILMSIIYTWILLVVLRSSCARCLKAHLLNVLMALIWWGDALF